MTADQPARCLGARPLPFRGEGGPFHMDEPQASAMAGAIIVAKVWDARATGRRRCRSPAACRRGGRARHSCGAEDGGAGLFRQAPPRGCDERVRPSPEAASSDAPSRSSQPKIAACILEIRFISNSRARSQERCPWEFLLADRPLILRCRRRPCRRHRIPSRRWPIRRFARRGRRRRSVRLPWRATPPRSPPAGSVSPVPRRPPPRAARRYWGPER